MAQPGGNAGYLDDMKEGTGARSGLRLTAPARLGGAGRQAPRLRLFGPGWHGVP